MTRLTVTLTLRRPGLLKRLWYRRLGTTPPLASGSTGPRSADLARLIPYSWRTFHRLYATTHRFFWLPCRCATSPSADTKRATASPTPPNTKAAAS